MSDTTVTYVPGAGAYPYRVNGLRLDACEAVTYLRVRCGMEFGEANTAVQMARVEATNTEVQVEQVFEDYRINGGEDLGLEEARKLLMREYRQTREEADLLLMSARRAEA